VDSRKISNTLIGVAGVHHVVCELSRRNLIALPTTRETAGYDVIVATPDGKNHANIQVKTSSHRRVRFWPVARKPADFRTGVHDYYVFLEGLGRDFEIQVYLLKGAEVLTEIKSRYKQVEDKRPFSYCLYVDDDKRKKWAAEWHNWNLDGTRRQEPA